MEPFLTTILDLDWQLGGGANLCIGGGLGLYLKQQYLRDQPHIRTLFPMATLPPARTTEDIDLFLRAEVAAHSDRMLQIRQALDALGFTVVESAKYMQFVRQVGPGFVKIDLLVGPLGEFAAHTRRDSRRVRPKGRRVNLHARRVDEAVAIETQPISLPLSGRLSSGAAHTTTVRIPQAFTYLLMKITAFRDQINDPGKDFGRHHALDTYRIVGLLTQEEDAVVRHLSATHRDDPAVVEVRRIVLECFRDLDALGSLRIREHPLSTPHFRLDELCRELLSMFPAP